MSLRARALAEFDLPAAPQRVDELGASLPGIDCCRVHAPAGRFLLISSASPLGLAFEATLFDLLAESRYPAPRPRRAKGGSLVAPLKGEWGTAAAACYGWPAGEATNPASATIPQLLEIGRLLGRLHQLGESHPASVADSGDGAAMLQRTPPGPERDALQPVLSLPLPSLPLGAIHGNLGPVRALFVGDRCAAVLPSGRACASSLLLDMCETAVQWMEGSPKPLSALRAIFSGYQALRRLSREELQAVPAVLRHAAAREGARRLALGLPEPLAPLRLVGALSDEELRGAAGA